MRTSSERALQRSIDSKALTVEVFADLTGELLRHVEQSDFLAVLGKFFEQALSFDNFIVYRYQDRCAAELLYTNLNFETLKARMRKNPLLMSSASQMARS